MKGGLRFANPPWVLVIIRKKTAGQSRNIMSMNQKPSHIMLRWIWLIVLIVLLDQGTKHLVVSSLEPNRPIAILPAVEFVLSYNTGVSFSFFRIVKRMPSAGRWSVYLF